MLISRMAPVAPVSPIGLVVLLLAGCGGTVDAFDPDGNFEPDHVLQVAIEMDEADWDALRHQSRSFMTELSGDCMAQPFTKPYTYFHASITVDGYHLPDIGIRKKGFIGSQSTKKPGFRLNLDEFVSGAELFGKDNMTLNNGVQDPALIRQCLTYDRFRAAGLPAPRCNFARVSMNGRDLGIYVHVEPIKRSFLRAQFGSDEGSLYEGTLSDFREGFLATYEPKTDVTDLALTQVRALTAALESSESKRSVLERFFDFDQLLSHLAMETITGHWDGYAGNRNNYYLYLHPDDGKFHLIPWGADGTMRKERLEEHPYSKGAVAHHVLKRPELREAFAERTRTLLDSIWVESEVLAEVDRMEALIGTEIDTEPLQPALEGLKAYIEDRRSRLERRLDNPRVEDMPSAYCLAETGQIEAHFKTTWGSLNNNPDLTRAGDLEIDMEWGEGPTRFVRAGIGAGYSDDDGRPLIAIVGLLDEARGAMFIPFVHFDPNQVEAGESISIGGLGVEGGASGGILYRDNARPNLSQAGFLGEGSLQFDRFGAGPGDPVEGVLESKIFSWQEQRP